MRSVHEPNSRGIGTVRYLRLLAKEAESARLLAARTLTSRYNQRPAWLNFAHRRLDEAVFAAYGWEPGLPDYEISARLLPANLERMASRPGSGAPPVTSAPDPSDYP